VWDAFSVATPKYRGPARVKVRRWRYSADVSYPPNPPPSADPSGPQRPVGRPGSSLLPWLLGSVVVLVLAVMGGLLAAWIVASMRAVPPPAAGQATPTPRASAPFTAEPSPDGQATARLSEAPRFTPTPSPLVTTEPQPFVHVVARGESLTLISDYYGVELEDVLALNDIRNPNRIQVGQEILIPGYGVQPSEAPG